MARWQKLGQDGKTTVFKSLNRQNSNGKKMNVQVSLGPFDSEDIQHNAKHKKWFTFAYKVEEWNEKLQLLCVFKATLIKKLGMGWIVRRKKLSWVMENLKNLTEQVINKPKDYRLENKKFSKYKKY